jgi:hypothetical protein
VISVDQASLVLDGTPVVWAMGEFHYARYPANEWRTELLKMKAGGIDVIASYVFWIHHEEIEGHWDWSGRRNLRHFVCLCQELELKMIVRGGPWAHGECRNGGFPDWVAQNYKTRTDDCDYLAQVAHFYAEIGRQLTGLLWKDDGPVIGFQVENEFGGPGEYLATLKKIAVEAGIHVPVFTRTGWPVLESPVPDGDIFPAYGGYPIGFWDRGIEETALKYGTGYLMSLKRNPDLILQGDTAEAETDPTELDWPYLCCEIGGGMAVSYHRRVVVSPDDIGSLAMVKLASGNNLQGYYMFHGGANPDGLLTTLNETQATGYWNDSPVKTYDFQAPIGEAGQIREHYHILRRMHLFMRDFGSQLARMRAELPTQIPSGATDSATPRWSVRHDGNSGYIFVNNYQRYQEMPAKQDIQFDLELPSVSFVVPSEPVSIPANSYFFWPFNMDLQGVILRYATAQPICMIKDGQDTSYFFAETPGVKPTFSFVGSHMEVISWNGTAESLGNQTNLEVFPSGCYPAVIFDDTAGHRVNIFVLDEKDSLHLWKGPITGQERVVLCSASVLFDRDTLCLTSDDAQTEPVGFAIYPPVGSISQKGELLEGHLEGSFQRFDNIVPQASSVTVTTYLTAEGGSPRAIHMGSQGVAEQPEDSDFDQAMIWTLVLPSNAAIMSHPILRLEYVGDVARIYLDGNLISDNFYNGKPHEIDLSHYDPEIFTGNLELRILPLSSDAPIYLSPESTTACSGDSASCRLVACAVYELPRVVLGL